jgi:PTS system fructose-specific IIA component/PTS system nitrogen regulatory IIA component
MSNAIHTNETEKPYKGAVRGSLKVAATATADELSTLPERITFANFVLDDAIRAEIKATDKPGVIREMVQSILDAGGIKKEDYDGIVQAITKREELGSTGLGRGIAIPHTKHPGVKRFVGCVAVSREGIDFDSLDSESVYLFFLLVSPPNGASDHLRVLEYITRQLKNDTFCRFLKQAKTPQEILSLLEEADSDMLGR